MNFTTSNINFFDELAQVKIPCFLSEDLLKLKNALSNGKKLEVTIVPERKKRRSIKDKICLYSTQ